MCLKYNYVIVGSGGYYLYGYRDIMDLSYVNYHKDHREGFSSPFQRILLRFNFSKIVNRFIRAPFSSYVYPRLFPQNFGEERPLCFLFFDSQPHIYMSSYMEYLRRNYPSAKLVLYMQDIVSSYELWNIEKTFSKFDLLMTYDMADAKKYNMIFHPTPMSYVQVPENKDILESDIYFCGKAKTRYGIVHDIYKKCCESGLKCDFHLLDMPEKVEHIDGIRYDTEYVSYEENIQRVEKSKCVLEIMQDGAVGFTPRLWESIVYDKHLLSNNQTILNSRFYTKNVTHILNDKFSFEVFIESLNNKVDYQSSYKQSLSPLHLLQTIDGLI